ncbi:MAG: hypothetical protein HXS54_05835 [Theionarchaea archaeon]|nr:hypothetical protein [Theionarchaea archaeon]DBA34888.1 TPA_asm: hypothetical protein vir521_00094 [Caudoviricetes sp. vir521]
MEEWEKAQLMADAIRAVNLIDKDNALDDAAKFERAANLANAGREAVDAILAKTQPTQTQTGSQIFPPGTREPPPEIVGGGTFNGMSREQVKEEMEKRMNEACKQDPKKFHTYWHASGLPIGKTRKTAFANSRYELGNVSKR